MKKIILLILFFALTNYCLSQEKLTLKKAVQIALDNSKDIVTTYVSRSIHSTVCSKRMVDGFNTYPDGFIKD